MLDLVSPRTPIELIEATRGVAEAALSEKDRLHQRVGTNIERNLDDVAAVWQRVEIALQAEQLAWIRAHGSPLLQQQATVALEAGGGGYALWQAGVPLNWAQAERMGALQPQVAQEWLARHRPGWQTWQPLDDAERRKGESLELRRLDERYGATNPEPVVEISAISGTIPILARTKPLEELMRAARAQDDEAQLGHYKVLDAPARRWRACAISKARFPGGYAPVQIVLRETPEQAHQLDQIAAYLEHPHTAGRTYEETLAAIVEVEANKPLGQIPDGIVRGVLLRIDVGPKREDIAAEEVRAIVVSRDAAHILLVDKKSLQQSVGKEILLVRGSDERVFVEAPDVPVVLGYEDVDARQQLQLRRDVMVLASMEQRDGVLNEVAISGLREISQRVERQLAACRALEYGAPRPDELLGELAPRVDYVRRDSALATEQLAWMAAYGSSELARHERWSTSSADRFEEKLREEWLRSQPGWQIKQDDGRQWKRVAMNGGPTTIHPALTMRDAAPVKEMMTDAWAQAPDAVLVASAPSSGMDSTARARPVHGAVIARRVSGSQVLEPLLRVESSKQRMQLDIVWKDRLRERQASVRPIPLAARLPIPELHNEADRLVARVQREFGVPAAALPDGQAVHGCLMRVERGNDQRHRAIVVNADHVHVVSVMPGGQLERFVGKAVSVEKTAGKVRIAGLEPKQDLGR